MHSPSQHLKHIFLMPVLQEHQVDRHHYDDKWDEPLEFIARQTK